MVNCINSELSVVAIDPIIQDCNSLKSHIDDVVVYHVKRHLNSFEWVSIALLICYRGLLSKNYESQSIYNCMRINSLVLDTHN